MRVCGREYKSHLSHTHPSPSVLFFRCSPPQDGDTPYDAARKYGRTKITELLDPKAAEEDKLREELIYAARNGNDDDVRSLLEAQVNVNAAGWVSTSARLSRPSASLWCEAVVEP